MTRLVRRDVAGLHAYAEEPQGGLNLMANTNLFGPNPAIERALAKVRADHLGEYPSLTSTTLRAAAARHHGVGEDMVVTGNGSNEIIDVVLRTFVEPGDHVAFHVPTFSMIPTFVRLNHGAPVAVPLGRDWQLDVDALLAADAKVTMLVRPNNPTGNAFPRRDVERLLRDSRGLVVVDEAYVDFLAGTSFVEEVRRGHDRLVVLRTLSKAHGLAGLRIGYALTSAPLAEQISKIRGPFRLNSVSETAGALALSDNRFLDEVVAAVRQERPSLQRMLEARGFFVCPSDANFLFTRPPVDAHALARALAEQGVWVRDFGGELSPYLRVTVGPPGVTVRFQRALDEVLPRLRGAS